jgi:uncharacterized membrane protein YhiD involved in acid resistance
VIANALADEWRLAVAPSIGLPIGGERERRKGKGADRGAAGIRTFALVALLGGSALRVRQRCDRRGWRRFRGRGGLCGISPGSVA